MKQKTLFWGTLLLLALAAVPVSAQLYVGGDVSLLQSYEDNNVSYYDDQGALIPSVLDYMKSERVGWNALRVRLFVDPSLDSDPQVCQDLDYVARLGKRIKAAGFSFMLDFHYSDTWADPSKQWTPAAWQSLGEEALKTRVYDYTRECLQRLVSEGATPDFIQTGNEISYGMLWGKSGTTANRCYTNSDANWPRFVALLQQAGKACREVCPDAKIIIHTERAGNTSTTKGIYERLKAVDYDVIGLSYYPFWHGSLTTLATTLNTLASSFPDKKVQIVETAYYYQWQPTSGITDYSKTWPVSEAGQVAFARDLIAELKKHDNVNGLYWWFPEENGNGPGSKVLKDWVNRGLWDDNTHRAHAGLYVLKEFLDRGTAAVTTLPADASAPAAVYNLHGQRVSGTPARPGLYIRNGRKYIRNINR